MTPRCLFLTLAIVIALAMISTTGAIGFIIGFTIGIVAYRATGR